MSQFTELLEREVRGFCRLSAEQLGALEAHLSLLQQWNRKLNLTAIRSFEEAVRVHYAESIFLASALNWDGVGSVADIGSGGGFPGIPVAIARPEVTVTLVESHQRKAVFLREASRGLGNVRIRSERFEAISDRFDLIISRAVAWDDISEHVARVGERVALLVSDADAENLLADSRIEWAKPITLPWVGRGKLVSGHVPRGTRVQIP